MMGWLRRLRRTLAAFGSAQRGVAAVEFALLLPVMLAVYIGTMEASMLITMDRKVQAVSGAVGDLVARSDKTILTAQMEDYFRAASGIMTPYPFEPVTQVVSALSVNETTGAATVLWTRQYADGIYSDTTPHAVGSTFNLPQEMVDISKGRVVIAAEASYSYTPLFGLFFTQMGLYRSSFFLPRFGGSINII